ncbi:hypothetical protein [Streptomyces resistomycificus]|uniref:hypothetical protein n=1 Tax=Streptomyces resistomycificus TaxID=67356 RepID=UPI0007C4DC5A|nr:hypothetical protein [Streptomyces resistomycificus]
MLLPYRGRSSAPVSTTGHDILRIVSAPCTPVFLTVHADGRRRYSYWQPFDPDTGRGSCYAALPTAECDALHSAGRITLGEAVLDPAKSTYRVRPARTSAAPARTSAPPARTSAEAARTSATPVRTSATPARAARQRSRVA